MQSAAHARAAEAFRVGVGNGPRHTLADQFVGQPVAAIGSEGGIGHVASTSFEHGLGLRRQKPQIARNLDLLRTVCDQ